MNKELTIKIEVSGMVQGVGFRPFVFNLAKAFALSGYVRNTGLGADIEVSGTPENIKNFVSKLEKSSFSASYKQTKIPYIKYKCFNIIKSKKTKVSSEFPHDLALCGECKKELFSKSDRRYKYPFINCIKCGPRFSIIKKLPYDRKNTAMNIFKMCGECESEYSDPSNRRFHAQPDACPKCGPKLYFYDCNKKLISTAINAFDDCVKVLKKGKIAAIKSIGGYHLVCDAFNINAVKTLRQRKNRLFKPFAIMAERETAAKFCRISHYEKKALLSDAAPIVLLAKKENPQYKKYLDIIAPDNNSLGVMQPYAPLHWLLIKEIPVLIMTSGNRSDEPICVTEEKVFENLKGIADCFLTNDRGIENRSDDSIVKFLPDSDKKIIIRRSRGFVPDPINVDMSEGVFAAGGDLKNNFCITRNNKAYMSQYTGDLSEKLNLDFYVETINKIQNFLEVKPKKAVCDAHPQYSSSRYAENKYKKNCFKVYHHYAHIASVIAEHNLKGSVLGFSFDGNGYGEDGKIWGGEVVLYKNNKFERLAHLNYFKLPGGDICTKEIWRIALSLLHKYEMTEYMPESLKKFDYKTVLKMLDKDINSPQTSSMGRLFDAIAVLLDIKHISSFEAEGAIALESLTIQSRSFSDFYPFKLSNGIIDIEQLITNIISDLRKKVSKSKVSIKFHNSICEVIIQSVLLYMKKYNTKQIALSGGVFQNMYILNRVHKILKSKNIKVYFNEQVPINDGGIALGQAFIFSNL